MSNIKRALLSMGYRKITRDSQTVYAKPIGYSLFVAKEDNRLYQYFIGANKKILCMQHWDLVMDKDYSLDGVLIAIKDAENYSHQIYTSSSKFDFLTKEQEAELMFDL